MGVGEAGDGQEKKIKMSYLTMLTDWFHVINIFSYCCIKQALRNALKYFTVIWYSQGIFVLPNLWEPSLIMVPRAGCLGLPESAPKTASWFIRFCRAH